MVIDPTNCCGRPRISCSALVGAFSSIQRRLEYKGNIPCEPSKETYVRVSAKKVSTCCVGI